MLQLRIILLLLLTLSSAVSSQAKPYVPEQGNTVLETVEKQNSPEFDELRKLEAENRNAPDNLEVTLQLINSYMNLAGKAGEPYYAGRAESLLAIWLKRRDIPDSLRLADAVVRQYNHDFSGAKKNLDLILVNNPKNIQARLLRSNIHRITGHYKEAQQDCQGLALLTDPMVVSVCQLSISTLTGKNKWSAEKLEKLINQHKNFPTDDVREWSYTILAEALGSIGEYKKAYEYLERIGKDLNSTSVHFQAQYIDLMLQLKRYEEAYKLLSAEKLPDVLLLRKAIIANKLKRPDTAQLAVILQSRYDDSKRAGRSGHLREQALYELHMGSAGSALTYALENWNNQKELIDTRIILEAALKSKRYADASPVIDWIKKNGTMDNTIDQLIKEIRENTQ